MVIPSKRHPSFPVLEGVPSTAGKIPDFGGKSLFSDIPVQIESATPTVARNNPPGTAAKYERPYTEVFAIGRENECAASAVHQGAAMGSTNRKLF